MNRHALEALEFPAVLEGVAERALSELGRARIRGLRPGAQREPVQDELRRVDETLRFLDRHRDWSPPSIPDATAALERLGLAGSVLEPGELFSLGALLESGRHLGVGLARGRGELPSLDALRDELLSDKKREVAISRTVDADGSVLDSASGELGRIRRRLRRTENRVVRALEDLLRSLPERIVVPDASVTIREGRYVIPVRREGRSEVGGAVLDESATGATLFVEPPVALEITAQLRDLQREEAREVQRVLREASEDLRPLLPNLAASQEALVTFDSLHARAMAALAWEGVAPELLEPGEGEMEIVRGRHPLLLSRGERQVVPFDLRMDPGERVLVVSGPNTGGKSVFLKALGLVSALAQAGVIPPVGEGTRIPFFTKIFADIGDEQSISESLSTFSAHLENLKEIVEEADGASLVLVDEVGTGTDPQEGAVLARAILEHLVERGALAVVTTHLGVLKRLDTPGSGMVNASLQFDPDRIEPTFQLLKGRPGRSYGLAIARRLGFPSDILDRAEDNLPREEARMEELLSTLERKEKEASELVRSLDRERAKAASLKEGLEEREEELRVRENTARSRAREEARQLLLEARQEVEAAIREVRAARDGTEGEEGPPEELDRRARRRVEEAARRYEGSEGDSRRREAPSGDLSPGDRVRLAGTGSKGTILEIREGRAAVETSGVRIQVPTGDLDYLGPPEEVQASPEPSGEPSAASWQGPEGDPETEVDLRGFRVSEVEVEVSRALDQAVLGGLQELRIIHGKGTGALREAVGQLLASDPRVDGYRMGGPGEGGAGVTVVRLR